MTAWMRAIVVLLLALLSINRAIEAFREYRKSVELKDVDPSASDAYLTFAQGDAALAVFVAFVALLAWRVIRPTQSAP
jgi:hypothetical protein